MQKFCIFFFNHTATTEIYTLSLHDALPISGPSHLRMCMIGGDAVTTSLAEAFRSEEHTSELQSRFDLVCRLLLEKKNITTETHPRIRSTRSAQRTSRRAVMLLWRWYADIAF